MSRFVPENHFQPLQPDTWEVFLEETGAFGMLGYSDATEISIVALNNILQISKDFAELKSNLTEWIKERQAFLDSAPAEKWALSESDNQIRYDAFAKRTSTWGRKLR